MELALIPLASLGVVASVTSAVVGIVGTLFVLWLLILWARNDPGKLAPLAPEPPSIQPEVDDAYAADDADAGGAEPDGDAAAPDPWDVPPDDAAPDVPLEEQVKACIEVLRAGRPGPCRDAVETLVKLGAPALPWLREALTDDDQDLRVDAQRAIDLIQAEGGTYSARGGVSGPGLHGA